MDLEEYPYSNERIVILQSPLISMSTFLAIVSLDNDIAQIISGLQNTFLDPLMV